MTDIPSELENLGNTDWRVSDTTSESETKESLEKDSDNTEYYL